MALKDFVNGEKLSSFAKKFKINIFNDLLGGKKLRYVTQEEYNTLTDDQKNDETIAWNIMNEDEIAYVQIREISIDEYWDLYDTDALDENTLYIILDN